ncbi:hypothetical protein G6F21_005814 [Rhizopus arrhizus]|nr:hypothetical protein G6F21_005814 [Rhizopus arrhizus]
MSSAPFAWQLFQNFGSNQELKLQIRTDQNGNNEPEKKKFDKFMGKLMLKSKQQTPAKQPTLTEEPFAGLFRIRKNRMQDGVLNEETTVTANKFTFRFLPENDKKNYRISSNGRKTRWDVSVHKDKQEEHSNPEEITPKENPKSEKTPSQNQEEDIFDDTESLTSLDSLQSDDDVLGPWIELGMIHPSKKQEDCKDCIQLNHKDRNPLDSVRPCSTCTDQWRELFQELVEKIRQHTPQTTKKKKVKLSSKEEETKIRSIKETTKTSSKNNTKFSNKESSEKRSRGKKSITIPPTQSKHSQSTNRKMMDFVSTGAFMTRKTAETLADPENGFYPNPYGYIHHQIVEVLNINGIWYRGTLEMMDKGKVLVKYSDWDDQEEWVIMGSRRLRIVPLEIIAKEKDEETKGQEEVNSLAINDIPTLIPRVKISGKEDDYVSCTLDKDPQQLFNDNEVFMTRRMARALVDEHGFRPNSFGYRRNRPVAVVFNIKDKECIGYLREMRKDQVRVWYPDLHQSEWIVMGSRRLRLLKPEEEEKYKKEVDLDAQEVPVPIQKPTEHKEKQPEALKPKKGRALKKIKAKSAPEPEMVSEEETVASTLSSSVVVKEDQTSEKDSFKLSDSASFLTTGAFATRRAMRQLQDENGFVPNPYNYTYNQSVEILNTRSGKTHFWECGQLVAMRPGQVKVHYDGWDDAYDEWIMVGSRRIRVLSKKEEEDKQKRYNDLLVAESNPEVQDEVKRKRKHQVIRPEDYQKLGLLENEQMIKKKKVKEPTYIESDSSSEEEFIPKRRSKKASNSHQKKKKAVTKQPIVDEEPPALEEEKQIISLRVAQAKASEKYDFVANVYGYDYMQHITILHLDKKLYEGRLVSMHKNKVKVHYCGWPDAFDEYITVGSRRIQPIENDHQVECNEPDYRERYEKMMQDGPVETCQHQHQPPVSKKLNRKRLTLEDVQDEEDEAAQVEYYKGPTNEDDEVEVVEMDSWRVYCNQCNVIIKQFRYYCTYCENPSIGHDYRSFELCLRCFDQNFPFWHEHPRSSFAIQAVIDAEIGPRPIKGELVTVWEEDVLEEEPLQEDTNASNIFTGEIPIDSDQGYKYLKRWKRRKVCAFCNDDDDTSEELGQFIGPFVIATYNKNGVEKKRSFWAHDACARYSPEVFCTPEGKWYNVTLALRRGRGMCYEKFPSDHPHNEDEFEETSLAILKEMEAQKAREAAKKKEEAREANAKKKKKSLFPRKRRKLPDGSTPISCCYCGTFEAESWRKGYDGGVMMCNPCFELALMVDNDERPSSDMPLVIHNTEQQYMTSIEDYSHKPYFTRDTATKVNNDSAVGQRLGSYEPQPNQLFSLTFDSTYFDIPGRAPRWATHSGTDYHGTWLPQTVRRAILKYTSKDERILSNFLGRGTDAIECFLLQRRCIGVDINPCLMKMPTIWMHDPKIDLQVLLL